MRVRFWGVRGSTPTPQKENMGYGGNTSCIEIRTDTNQILVFDGGTGIRLLGNELQQEVRRQAHQRAYFLQPFPFRSHPGHSVFPPSVQSTESLHLLFRRTPRHQSCDGRACWHDGQPILPCRHVKTAMLAGVGWPG